MLYKERYTTAFNPSFHIGSFWLVFPRSGGIHDLQIIVESFLDAACCSYVMILIVLLCFYVLCAIYVGL